MHWRRNTMRVTRATDRPPRTAFEDVRVDRPLDRIAAARGRFQSRTVQDVHLPAAVCDQALLLQCAGRLGNAHTPYPHHVREELLGDMETGRVCPVLAHEKPPREAGTNQVEPQADR